MSDIKIKVTSGHEYFYNQILTLEFYIFPKINNKFHATFHLLKVCFLVITFIKKRLELSFENRLVILNNFF